MKFPGIFSGLLVRPKPMEGESDWGFWLRLAEENGLKRPQWLLSNGERWPAGLTRHCPACLGTAHAMWSQEWSEAGAIWCRLHGSWLMDKCPSCKRKLRWSNVRFRECACGFDFRRAEKIPVNSAVAVAVATEVASPEFLRLLGAFALHGASGKPGKKIRRIAIEEARSQQDAGIDLISQWPQGFYKALDKHRALVAGPGTAQLLREAFPGLVEWLDLVSDEHWRTKVSIAIDEYCVRALSSTSPIIGRNPLLSEGPPTLKEISVRLGRRLESITEVIDGASTSLAAVRVTGHGRRRRVVGDEAVTRLAAVLGERVAVETAARQVALPPSRLRALVVAGRLTLQRGRLLQSELADLAELTVPVPGDAAAVRTRMGPLRKALRDWVHVDETAALFCAIQAGKLKVLRPSTSCPIGEWLVSGPDIEAWAAGRRGAVGSVLSLGQAAQELGLKHDVALCLVRKGLLPAEKGTLAHRSSWLVSKTDLAAFSRRYTPLAALVRDAGVRVRDGFEWALSRGLKVVCGPKVDGTRQYFVEQVEGRLSSSQSRET